MSNRANIALMCALSPERAALSDWLSQSGYSPVLISDLSSLDDDLQLNSIEALIADASFVPREDDVRNLVRQLGNNRPLMILGEARHVPKSLMAELSFIVRPITRESFLLSVGLALAEGRPARRFPRREVEPIVATANGIAVIVREASTGGVGLEFAGSRPSVLPPYFRLRIPEFGVHVVVKRAWLAMASPRILRCGGTIEGDVPGGSRTWAEFAREAPAPVISAKRRMDIQ